jgi:2',3'-cyclic-nucleotide 2'-phosphodiesterase/3'-nucleotidase
LVNPAVPGYNFDIAEGVDYTIDLAREPGERILDLRFEGRALGDDQKLKVAINNYRESGGGGYTMLAEAPVLSRSNVGIRQLIVDWVLERGNIPTEATRNWSLRLP